MTTESVNMVDEMDVWSEIDLATTGSSEDEDVRLKYGSQNRNIVGKSMFVRVAILSAFGVTLLLVFYSVTTLRTGALLGDNGLKSTSVRRLETRVATFSLVEPTSEKRSMSDENDGFNESFSDDALRNDKTILTRFEKWRANHPQLEKSTTSKNINNNEDEDGDFDFSRYFSDDALRTDQDHTISRFIAWQKKQENKEKLQQLDATIEMGRP